MKPMRQIEPGDQLLNVENVSLRFGGVKAITDVSFDIRKGEVRAIIGPNGAGKTTLLDLICGKTKASGGSIKFKNTELTSMAEHKRVRLGIGRKFQKPSVFEQASVLENLWLACQGEKGWLRSLRQRIAPGQAGRIDEVIGRAVEALGLSPAGQAHSHLLETLLREGHRIKSREIGLQRRSDIGLSSGISQRCR